MARNDVTWVDAQIKDIVDRRSARSLHTQLDGPLATRRLELTVRERALEPSAEVRDYVRELEKLWIDSQGEEREDAYLAGKLDALLAVRTRIASGEFFLKA